MTAVNGDSAPAGSAAYAPYRAVLEVPQARVLVSASAVSELGSWLYNAALLAVVFRATHSVIWVGGATVSRLLPYVLFAPVGGTLADRMSRRTVLLVGNALCGLLMVGLTVVVATHGPVALVIGLAALSSAAASAERPAALALLPRVVGEVRLGVANALMHGAQDVAVIAGPAIGALLLAVGPASVAFAVNAATYVVAAVLVTRLQRDPAPSAVQKPPARAGGGLRAPHILALLVLVATVEFTYGAQTVLLVVYGARALGLGAAGYGILLAASGVGGVVSAGFNGRLATSRRLVLVLVAAAVLASLSEVVYAATTVVAVAIVVTALGGASLVACEVGVETVLGRIVARERLGRVAGVMNASSIAAMLLGAVLASALVAATSLHLSLIVLGAIAIGVALLCSLGLGGLDAASNARADALAERLAILERLPITTGATRLVLEQLASASQLCPLPPGIDVVVQGAPAHAFFAVVSGRVVIHRDGQEVVHLGPGDSFGEQGLLGGTARNATVTTELPTTVLRIAGAPLLEALGSAPALATAVSRVSEAPGVTVPSDEIPLVDDPRWASA
jgi:MFS family permease